MAGLKDIRIRIDSVRNIQKVTSAMKMVAAAKLRRAQMNMERARPYSAHIDSLLTRLLPDIDRDLNPLLEIRDVKRVGVVVVTGDRGLCGGFNTNIIRKATGIMNEYDPGQMNLVCVGRKGRDHFRRRNISVSGSYTDFWKELNFGHAVSVFETISEMYESQSLDRVILIYNEFKNIIQQKVVTRQLLPLVPPEPSGQDEKIEYGGFLFEPSKEQIVKSIVPRHLKVQVWQALLESYASEQAARMSAMEAATSNAADMISSLTLEYNKARQAAITKELLEIVGGAEALVNSQG